uniref:Guanine nucleotide-releasing factor 2 n=2 Tax=Ceratitis capitata TaxID=7213 RepID=W8AU66_CERCA
MRILSTELRLRVKNRKPRPFMRAASADAAIGDGRCSTNLAFEDVIDGASVSYNRDSAISSPSTPNSSLSSQSNLVCAGGGSPSPNTPSPATPTSQQSANTPLSGNSVIYQAPGGAGYAVGTSGHKNSLKGTKLARRARSFKDDLIEKISMIRTPNNTLGR